MKEVHLICNAHIDPIWQWDWQEGVSATLSTFQSAVNLSKDFDYIFCHNEVSIYKYVEEYAPKLFEEIKALVKAGKWHIMGGWYLQPDCNMPSGESFVRQIQEGRLYFTEKFGTFPTTAINFDPFGHTVGLVQIIKKCGQDGYLFMRPYPTQLKLPHEVFIWRGLDGSEIKAARTGQYNTQLGISAETIKQRVSEKTDSICLVTWGVGNHGGGPSRKDLGDIKELMETSEDKYIHSTPEAFFSRYTPTAVFDKSLHISMPGCYTSMARVKKKHAMLENEISVTEKMLSAAYARGLLDSYPEEQIRVAVQDLLNAQFHDVLPGSSVQCGEDNGMKLLDHGLLEAERLKTRAYFALSSACEPAGEGEYPILIFNPHPYPVSENFECEFVIDQGWRRDIISKITVRDEAGNEIPCQQIKEEANMNLDWRKRMIFKADLLPLGFHRYSVYYTYVPVTEKAEPDALVFDNGHKYAEIDKKTGLLKKYAIDGVDYVKDGFRLMSFADNPDPWGMSDEQLLRLGTDGEPFKLSEKPAGVFEGMKSIQVIEDGDIYLGVEAFFEKDHTRAKITYKIYKNNDYIDVDVTLFLGDVNRIIKLELPIASEGKLIGQCAFGTDELFRDARENVAHRFVAMSDGERALTLMNTGVYGSHYENGSLYMSLVRGVTYCAHPIEDRQLIPTDRFTKKIDQGELSFSFRLGVVDADKLERETQVFVQKPYGLNIFPIPKTKDAAAPFAVKLSDDTVSVQTIKKAYGRDGIIFRLLNNTDHAASTTLSVDGAKLDLSFGKYEVKTVIYEGEKLTELDEMII